MALAMVTELREIALALGAGLLAVGGVGICAPAAARRALAGFPRNRTAAWVLTALALGWWAARLYHAIPAPWDAYRNGLFVVIPGFVVLFAFFMDELLAARALGGVLILAPGPILDAARWHPSAWRYLPIVLAYGMVVAGAWLVAAPYVFRKAAERLAPADGACRRSATAVALLGAGLVVLGAMAF